MPKIVDHEERRRLIADAFATVVRRDGVAGASVRAVAAEAGISPGAMRHYFDTQTGLLRFVAQDLTERLTAQMAALAPEATGTDSVVLLEELVPLDARRQADFDVWLALVVGGLTEPALAEISAEAHAAIRNVCRHVLREHGVRRPTPDQVRRLHAFVDGISMHLALYPDVVSRAAARRSLRAEIPAIAGITLSP